MLKKLAVAGLVLAASTAAQAAQVGFNISTTDVTADVQGSSTSRDYKATEYGFAWATSRTRSFHFRGAANLLDGEIGTTDLEGFTGSFIFAFGVDGKGKKKQDGGFWIGPALYVGSLEGKDVDTDLGYFGPGLAAGIDIPTSSGSIVLEAAYRKLDATQDFFSGNDQDYDIDGVQLRASLLFGD